MDNAKIKRYGLHLILDCYEADSNKLADPNLLANILDQLPEIIGMRKIGKPQIAEFDEDSIAGVSGIIMIATSHISIHTYCKKDCFFMDVFSCQDFDPRKVVDYIKTTLSTRKIVWQVIERGLEFPTTNLHP